MLKSARKTCAPLVKGCSISIRRLFEEFEECCKGRFISLVWKCRDHNKAMEACLKAKYFACFHVLTISILESDFEREKAIFLQKRKENTERIEREKAAAAAAAATASTSATQ